MGVLNTDPLQEIISYLPCQGLSLSLHSIKGLDLTTKEPCVLGRQKLTPGSPGSWQHKAPIVRAGEAWSLKQLIPRMDDSDKED